MNPTIWLILFIAVLTVEAITMNLWGACFIPGTLAATIMSFCEVPTWISIIVFLVLSALMVAFARPVLARIMYQKKKQARLDMLIGCEGVVICEIFNAHGVGVVNIRGREYRAKSHRPNAVISEGSKVKVVAMRGDIAIVDDLKRTSTGRINLD